MSGSQSKDPCDCGVKARQTSQRALLALMVLSFVSCAEPGSGLRPNGIQTHTQATPNVDRFSVLKIRGVVKDHEGKRVRGSVVGVMFAMYEQRQGGAVLWQEIQNIDVDSVGRFTALVGSTKSEGIPPELFATRQTRWLGKQVLLPGEVEGPRIPVVGTPHGLMAGSAAMLVKPPTLGDQPAAVETQQVSDDAASSQQHQRHKSVSARRWSQRHQVP